MATLPSRLTHGPDSASHRQRVRRASGRAWPGRRAYRCPCRAWVPSPSGGPVSETASDFRMRVGEMRQHSSRVRFLPLETSSPPTDRTLGDPQAAAVLRGSRQSRRNLATRPATQNLRLLVARLRPARVLPGTSAPLSHVKRNSGGKPPSSEAISSPVIRASSSVALLTRQ